MKAWHMWRHPDGREIKLEETETNQVDIGEREQRLEQQGYVHMETIEPGRKQSK